MPYRYWIQGQVQNTHLRDVPTYPETKHKMKTTVFREKRLTYSKDDKDGKDPRVCGAGRKGLSHIMRS